MRILIDECLDWRLCQSLADHACTSVQRMGWGGLANGELLRKAEQEFDVFITGDRNLTFQQAPENFDISAPCRGAISVGRFAGSGNSRDEMIFRKSARQIKVLVS